MARKGAGLSLAAPDAEPEGDGKRHCQTCGDFIDPIDWCPYCRKDGEPCRRPHTSLRKRSDAKFCDDGCRSEYRSSFIRDCL
jgi:hypothetical protein